MSRQTRKGYIGESLCAKMFNEWGEGGCPTRARRGDGTIGEDVYVHVGAAEFRVECKFHKDDIKTVRKWLEGSDALYFRTNHKEPWIALKPNALRDMLKEAYRAGRIDKVRGWRTEIKTLKVIPGQVLTLKDGGMIEEVGGQPITKAKEEE